jgi:hypothetical protein
MDGMLLPKGKITHQLHTSGAGRGEREGLFSAMAAVSRVCFLCHNFFLSEGCKLQARLQTKPAAAAMQPFTGAGCPASQA